MLHGAGIDTDGLPMTYLLMYAELTAVICSGALAGKQRTYALFDERVPPAPPRDRDEALADLTRRYFTSHGPATRADYLQLVRPLETAEQAALADAVDRHARFVGLPATLSVNPTPT